MIWVLFHEHDINLSKCEPYNFNWTYQGW